MGGKAALALSLIGLDRDVILCECKFSHRRTQKDEALGNTFVFSPRHHQVKMWLRAQPNWSHSGVLF